MKRFQSNDFKVLNLTNKYKEGKLVVKRYHSADREISIFPNIQSLFSDTKRIFDMLADYQRNSGTILIQIKIKKCKQKSMCSQPERDSWPF